MSSKFNRRSFLSRVGATASLGAMAVVTGACDQLGLGGGEDTDTAGIDPGDDVAASESPDGGSTTERAEYGRGISGGASRGTGCLDSDSGANADPANTAPCPEY